MSNFNCGDIHSTGTSVRNVIKAINCIFFFTKKLMLPQVPQVPRFPGATGFTGFTGFAGFTGSTSSTGSAGSGGSRSVDP